LALWGPKSCREIIPESICMRKLCITLQGSSKYLCSFQVQKIVNRRNKRQSLDTSIESDGSHRGFHLADGANQSFPQIVYCTHGSFSSSGSFYSKDPLASGTGSPQSSSSNKACQSEIESGTNDSEAPSTSYWDSRQRRNCPRVARCIKSNP
jgi:hypothetical protein